MPIIVTAPDIAVADGRSIRLPGLPDFNAGDPTFKINTFDGWFDGQGPTPVLVANGGGPGAVAVGNWEPVEQYYTLSGRVDSDPAMLVAIRRLLLAALPADREVALVCLGNGLDVDLQVFVRLYDKPTMPPGESVLRFTFPLVAPDPYKYALAPLTGSVGVFSGVDWYRTYDVSGTPPFRTYAADGSRTYVQSGVTGAYPLSFGATSPGDAPSRRVTVDVVGPQSAGWWLERDDASGSTVERIYTDLALSTGQTLTYDSVARSARLNGADVSHLTFGDFLTLPPGDSTFRLVSSDDLGGYATISALPAYL